jgi:hypothetical protein
MFELEMIMRPYWLFLRSAAMAGVIGIALPGCDSVLTPFVGQSKEAAAHAVPPPPPPSPPPTTAFVNDSTLLPGFAGQTILPPTLPTAPDVDAADDTTAASAGPHQVIAAVPLSSDPAALAALSAAANREQGGADTRFVLLVLSPPAPDAPTLDRNNNAARLAAATAVKVMGDSGIGPDRIEVSMATSPTGGTGELRLYRR